MNNQEKFEKIFALTVEVKAKESGTGTEINIPTEWWDAEYKPKQCQSHCQCNTAATFPAADLDRDRRPM